MTPNTKTIAATVEGLPELPTGYDRYEFRKPKEGDLCYSDVGWREVRASWIVYYNVVAVKSSPWYPKSWLNDIENVFEVGPNEWPPCKPTDVIEYLTKREQTARSYYSKVVREAALIHWDAVAAIRIVERS